LNTAQHTHEYKFHVLLVTPEVVMQDVELLKTITWSVLICDEAQRLKNKQSRFYKELIDFKTLHTILLSGTPLQNNISELYSLLVFLDFEKFHDESEFMESYGDMTDAAQVAKLQDLIRPYMLRYAQIKHATAI
jgi:chromodomain-helicase-DNA-binding protein 4